MGALWAHNTAQDRPGTLTLTNQDGAHPITRHEPHNANEALGIQIRPDGKMDDEARYLHEKVKSWCDAVRTKRIHPDEAWYCLNATIMRTIEYPLTATCFTKPQLDQIMSTLLATALPIAGIQRRMPRKLVYGPVAYQGLGIHHPYWTQLIRHLQTILFHWDRPTPTCDLIEDNMELVQTYVGSDQNFWELPFPLYGPLAPEGWVKSTWEALSQTPLTLTGPPLAQPKLRQGDHHLMDVFLSMNPNDDELQTLQDCSLYLRVFSLAEISNAAGTALSREAWEGKHLLDHE